MKFLSLLMIFFVSIASATECKDAKIKIIYDKKATIAKEVLCFEKTSDNLIFYVSKSCAKYKCEILKRNKINLIISDYNNNIGSPGFKLCTKLGGLPQIYEFSIQSSQWQSADRCIFEKDFVEISLLTREWKNYIKNE